MGKFMHLYFDTGLALTYPNPLPYFLPDKQPLYVYFTVIGGLQP